MQLIQHQNIASSKVSVTDTATLLFSLINTAGSVSNSQAFFNNPANGGPANGLFITPEDGNIRLGYGVVPTASLGTLLSSGTKYFIPNIRLENIKLIRTGGSSVACSIDILQTTPGEAPMAVAEAVTLEASSITIGNVTNAGTFATQVDAILPSQSDLATLATSHVKKYYTSAGAATDGIIWSPAAGKRWFVTDIFIQVSVASTITLEDDLTAGDSPVWKAELAANSGWSHSFTTPLFSGEDAADLLITTTAGNVYVTVTGYEI